VLHTKCDVVAEATFIDAILVCAGLGARSLGGVEDKDMYPIRGQTVLIRAPWVKFGSTQSNINGTWSYIMPRRSGDVSAPVTFTLPTGSYFAPHRLFSVVQQA
jgi:glycine/D-amino acid oxidase-like deaminating enzyme